jgi:myosin-1
MFSKKEGVDDLCLISSMTNDEITGQLKSRLARELIYTNIGDVLVSVNPFKRLPIYGHDYIQMYSSATSYDTAPHIYALAQSAYSNMMQENQPQSVIISGESGAGKTECAKLILNFISAVSGTSQLSQKVKAAIESTNPLLESFGNAKTTRNDNSSRFGKYLEICFNEAGEPAGGTTMKFLLEKARVVNQAKGERNFHIFYQLVKGASNEMKEAFGLGGVGDYYYLSQSGTNSVNGVDDSVDFQEVLNAMRTIGIDDNAQWRCFQVLAAILHIGNITFDGDPKGVVTNMDELRWAAYLLSVEEARLSHMLTVRLMASPRGSMYESPQNGIQCYAMRDALAKTLYNRVFTWLVEKINESMKPQGLGGRGNVPSHNSMGRGGSSGGVAPPRPPPGRGAAPPPRMGGAPPPRSNNVQNSWQKNNNAAANNSSEDTSSSHSNPLGTSKPHHRSIGVLDICKPKHQARNRTARPSTPTNQLCQLLSTAY